MTSKYEDAKKCLKCGQPGEVTATTFLDPGEGKAETLFCRNEVCLWLNTPWIIQVLPDGSIPERKAGPKIFDTYTAGQESLAKQILEDIKLQDPPR